MPFTPINKTQPSGTSKGFTPMVQGTTDTTTKSPSLLGTVGNFAKGIGSAVMSGLSKFGTGIGASAGETVLGTAKTALDITSGLGKTVGADTQYSEQYAKSIDTLKNTLYGNTGLRKEQLQSIPGQLGKATGEIAQLALPTGTVGRGKNLVADLEAGLSATKPAALIKSIPFVGKTLAYMGKKALNAVPEASLGFAYGKAKGESNVDALHTATGFALASMGFEIAGDTFKTVAGSVADNVARGLGVKGKMSVSQALQKIPNQIKALKVIADNTDGIKVKDISGVEKPYIPTKASIFETADAYTQIKKKVFDTYSELATKAGDASASFGVKDFNSVISSLKDLSKNATSGTKNKVNSIISDLEENYKLTDPKTGELLTFKNTPLKDIQDFVQKLNVDVNPQSDKAGSVVSQKASEVIREILDNKITKSTGEGYQAVRDQYSALKGIENDLTNQVKKEINKSGRTLPAFIEGLSTVESFLSLLHGDAFGAAQRIAPAAVLKTVANIKSSEKSLQRAFEMLNPEEKSLLRTRLTGVATPPGK